MTLKTPRLLLRPIEPRDRAAYHAMMADPEVTRFAQPLTPAQCDANLDRYARQLARDGYSLLTLEHGLSGDYLGIVGMQVMPFAVPSLPQPAVEIGWFLVRAAHGKGYATEAARAIVQHAFDTLQIPELIAITAVANRPSRNVMEKLGMTHRPELSFERPQLPEGHPHRRHVLYSLANPNL